MEEYLSTDLHDQLWAAIYEQAWSITLKRRVQHYGYVYDYKRRAVDASMRLGPLPAWAEPVAERLAREVFGREGQGRAGREDLALERPDQLIVNEYQPGQGIAPHVDCVPCFGPTIVSVSLGAAAEMRFAHAETGRSTSLVLAPRSALVLSGPARYAWTHGIPARKSDMIDGRRVPRGIRVSLTFRQVQIAN